MVGFARLHPSSLRLVAVAFLLAVGSLINLGAEKVLAQSKNLDNFGTEFYVVFGPNLGGENSLPIQKNLMALYITSRAPARGAVEVPGIKFYQTFNTTPGQITTIVLPSGNNSDPSVEIRDDETILPGMAVHITSDSAVAVFGMNHMLYSSDAFMALPVRVLGTEYRTMCYQTSDAAGSLTPSQFWIAGTQDGTNVSIIPRARTENGVRPGDTVNLILNAGDAYLVRGNKNDPRNDLTGSLIISDRSIAAFSGHERTSMPADAQNSMGTTSRDHLCEQLPPVSAWGDSAYVVPYATSVLPDLVRAVSSEDGNQIKVNGSVVATLNAGGFYEITELPGVVEISGTKPILVGQYLHTSYGSLNDQTYPPYGDPAMALVFPVEQFANSYTVVSIVDAASFTGNFVNIVAPSTGIASMRLDGIVMDPTEFKPIPGSVYTYAQHRLKQGTHTMYSDQPFGVTIYALGNVDSYSYVGGTLLKTITPLKTTGIAIDFGDRILKPYNANPLLSYANKFDTTVGLTNISDDTVEIYSYPRRTEDTSKFHVIDPLLTPVHRIFPHTTDSMTIEFEPREPNRRMHTQITAKTDHLRAYVVDVYGRGVLEDLGLFADSLRISTIDTLNFGVFTNTDSPLDSFVYLSNAGSAPLNITGATIAGPNASDFTFVGAKLGGAPVVPPYTLGKSPSTPAQLTLRFSPNGANTSRMATVSVTSQSGVVHTVVLLAQIHTIYAPTGTSSIGFGTTYVCQQGLTPIEINNTQNDISVTVTDLKMSGLNPQDFTLATRLPLIVKPFSKDTVFIRFAPSNTGTSNATALLTFDRPKGATLTTQLMGTGLRRSLRFGSNTDFQVNGEQTFNLPIYALTELSPFCALGFQLSLHYDSTHLELLDVTDTNSFLMGPNPLIPPGFLTLSGVRGGDSILYQSKADKALSGGGPAELRPLVLLRFRSHLNGADPVTFDGKYPVNYDVHLSSPCLAEQCLDIRKDSGIVKIVGLCANPQLLSYPTTPTSSYIEQNNPNPFNPATAVEFAIGTEGPVRLTVDDAYGHEIAVLRDEVMKPGYYTEHFNGVNLSTGTYFVTLHTEGYKRTRRMLLIK